MTDIIFYCIILIFKLKVNKVNTKEYYKEYYIKNKSDIDINNRKYQINNPEKTLLTAIKSRSKKNNIPFNLTIEDIVFPKTCPVLGIELVPQVGMKYSTRETSPSVDRIIPALGYIKGNIQIISFLANAMKRNATKEQLVLFAKWINKTYA